MAKPPFKGRGPRGNARYDLSGDEKAAKAGDRDAEKRVATKRRLDLARLRDKSSD